MESPSIVVDHLILTTFFASLFAFLLLYLLRRRSNDILNRSKKIRSKIDETLTMKSGGDGVDIIIVGAGVAGAALAHTLGKVISFFVFIQKILTFTQFWFRFRRYSNFTFYSWELSGKMPFCSLIFFSLSYFHCLAQLKFLQHKLLGFSIG